MHRRYSVAILVLLGVGTAVFVRIHHDVPQGLVSSNATPGAISGPPAPELPANDRVHRATSEIPGSPPPPTNGGPLTSRPARTDLPRIDPEHYDGGLRSLAAFAQPNGPVDRRSYQGPRGSQELEAIRYGLETLDDDIAACLDQWNSIDRRDAGNVLIGFNIDDAGLQKSWVQSDAEVPFGPRTCFANAIYGIDWSHIVDKPVQITNRFELSRKDGG